MAYMSTKLMQVVSSKDLNSRLTTERKPVRVYSCHPGVILTGLYDHLWYIRWFRCVVRLFFQPPEQGADCVVFVAMSPELETDGGEYFMNCKKYTPNPLVRDPSIQQRLWTQSQSLVGLKSVLNKNKELSDVVIM